MWLMWERVLFSFFFFLVSFWCHDGRWLVCRGWRRERWSKNVKPRTCGPRRGCEKERWETHLQLVEMWFIFKKWSSWYGCVVTPYTYTNAYEHTHSHTYIYAYVYEHTVREFLSQFDRLTPWKLFHFAHSLFSTGWCVCVCVYGRSRSSRLSLVRPKPRHSVK